MLFRSHGTWPPPNGHETETQDQWTETQEHADIDGAPLFYTEPTQQATAVCVEDDEEEYDAADPALGAFTEEAKKKGESHRGTGFTEKEDKCLCDSWLAVSHDSINGAQQKGNVYWRKVIQEYHERKLHEPYNMHSSRTNESIWKRWTYIKQETSKFCAAMDHVIAHPESGTGVVAVVRNTHHQNINVVVADM